MKKTFKLCIVAAMSTILFCSCVTRKNSLDEVHPLVKFDRNDFELSDQVTASASCAKVFYINWSHIFSNDNGTLGRSEIPVIGGIVRNTAEAEALYNLIKNNPGYDVVFYPQFQTRTEKHILGIQFTTVKVTARMGKLKKD